MPENMDLTPRATSSSYNDLYPDSGNYLNDFEEAMSRDIDVDNGEEDGCDSLEEKREVHHTHQSAVKEHGSNKTLAYDNGETEIRPLSYNECQNALATLPPNELVHVDAEEIEELRHYTKSSRRMQDGPWDPEMLAKGSTHVPGQSPGTIVSEATARGQQTHSSSSHEQTKSTATSSDTRSEAVFSASSHTGTATALSSTVYVCGGCGAYFDRPADGRKHERYHLPSDKRPYPCDEPNCGKSFVDSHKLGRHKTSHSKERTFACDLCSKCYKRKDILQRHRRVSHKNVLAGGVQVPANPQYGAAATTAQLTSRAAVASEIPGAISGAVPAFNRRLDDDMDGDIFPTGAQYGAATASAQQTSRTANAAGIPRAIPGAVLIFTNGTAGDLDIRFILNEPQYDATTAAAQGVSGAGNDSEIPGVSPGVIPLSSDHVDDGLASGLFLAESQPDAASASAQNTNRADVPAEISTDIPGVISTSNVMLDDDLDADFFPDFISRANVRYWLGSGF